MLQFFSWLELVASRRHDWRLADAMAAAEGRQRRVRQLQSAGRQLLPHPHQIPLATGQQLQDLLPVRFGSFGTQ